MKAIDAKLRVRYVCESDRALPESERTTWCLRPLTSRESQRIHDATTHVNARTQEITIRSDLLVLEHLRFGVVGVENFGAPFAQQNDGGVLVASDSFLDAIPREARHELSGAISALTSIPETDAKN